MMPWSSSVFSRSARMLEEMPSSDLVSSSRKCRRLPNIMSRITSRLHLSPTTSRVRLIGQPERPLISFSVPRMRCSTSVLPRWSGVQSLGPSTPVLQTHQADGLLRCARGARLKNRLQYRTSYPRLQLVAKCKWYGEGTDVAKLIMWNLMTLDGFVEGPNRDISWHLDVWGEELERLSVDQLKAAGGLMFGRVTYELMANPWPNQRGDGSYFMNALPKYVFSRTLTRSNWNNTQLFGADAAGTVARLKRDSAKDIFLFGSADLAASLIPHGLIDEFRIAVNPTILGGGTPLFKPGERVKLKLLDTRALSTGIVILRYQQH